MSHGSWWSAPLALAVLVAATGTACRSMDPAPPAAPASGIPSAGDQIDDAILERELPPPPADAVAYEVREPLRNGRTVVDKKRWIWVPAGKPLVATAGPGWKIALRVPKGTKLWKEFYLATRAGPRLVERRLLLKVDDRDERNGWLQNGGWQLYAAHYLPRRADGVNGLENRLTVVTGDDGPWSFRPEQWMPTQNKQAATFVAFAGGKDPYVFPGKVNCHLCHGGAEGAYAAGVPVLAFGSHLAKLTRESLRKLVARKWIAAPPALIARLERAEPSFLQTTGEETKARLGRQVLAELQNNCLSCHNSSSLASARETGFALAPMEPYAQGELERTLAGRSRVMGSLGRPMLTPARPAESELALRLGGLEARRRMPPAEGGVPELDRELAALVDRWILSL
jgi:mono/diheme cytochrome c family protein